MAADFNPLDLHELVGSSGMTLGEMITSFRQAKDRRLQLHALAELTLLKEAEIKDLLISHGVSYKEFPRAPRKKVEPPDIKPEDAARLQAERDRPKPSGLHKPKAAPPPIVAQVRELKNRYEECLKELKALEAQLDEIHSIITE